MKRIFDCFTFFNEIELLEFRLRECYDAVDYFVICEGVQTFQGKPKPLYFRENESRFAEFQDKIIYKVVEGMPDGSDPWAREHFQRNYIRKALEESGVQNDDMIVISDADEILNPFALSMLRRHDGYFQIVMPMYQFCMNYLVAGAAWTKPYAANWRLIKLIKDLSVVRTRQDETFAMFGAHARRIDPGGWHFTFLGGAARVREKLSAYSHTESHLARLLEEGRAEQLIQAGFNNGGITLTKFMPLDESFPRTLTNDVERYRELGFVKLPIDRIAELEKSLQELSDEFRAERRRNAELFGKAAGLISHANDLLRPYRHPHFNQVNFSGPNLIPASRDFSRGWYAGTQSRRAEFSDDVQPYIFGNAVMRHYRDGNRAKEDNNVGWFEVNKSHLELGATYTASCYVWIPSDARVSNCYMTVSLSEPQYSRDANVELRDTWQRISSSTLYWKEPPDSRWQQAVTLRISGEPDAAIHSTCWQFEIGAERTTYRETPST